MNARAYEVVHITGIATRPRERAHTPAAELDAARGFVLGMGISAVFWVLLIALVVAKIT
jgi:hypothetical protein